MDYAFELPGRAPFVMQGWGNFQIEMIGALAGLAMVYTHPLYLLMLFAGTASLLAAAGGLRAWRATLGWVGLAALAPIVLNPLVCAHGTTVLWTGPRLPVVGRVTISLEALVFGAMMGLKMVLLMSLVVLYDRLQAADRALDVWGRAAPKTALTLVMTSALLPRLTRDLHSIREALMARGADWRTGSWAQRLRQAGPILRILLLSSLEGSWQTSEALYARGFGSGKRSSYWLERWQVRDSLVVVATLLVMMPGIAVGLAHQAQHAYYPTLGPWLHSDARGWLAAFGIGTLGFVGVTWRILAPRS